VSLLRERAHTVDQLAAELRITDNAVRAHLQALKSEGLVHQAGVQRGAGAGKPARLYELSPRATELLSHAFVPLLDTLLETLADRVPAAEVERVMDDVGTRLARQHPAPRHTKDRVAHALRVVEQLGGSATVAEHDGTITISSSGCVLSPVTAHHPSACRAMQALLTELVGRPVTERCERGERARCRFEVKDG
jgi:predicted ArsR family transcriptional regulator